MQITPNLLLIRHGQTDLNAAGILQGRMDSDLTALGRRQMAQARLWLLHGGFLQCAKLWSSSSARAVKAAAIIAGGERNPALHTDDRLQEADFGKFESHGAARVGPLVQEDGHLRAFPAGESEEEVKTRVLSWWNDAQLFRGTHIAVGHSISLWVLRSSLAQNAVYTDNCTAESPILTIYQIVRGRETRVEIACQ